MITFIKEQLIASAHARIEFAEMMLAGELEPLKERTWSIELELARIALASLEAEPYGYVHKEAYDAVGSCGLSNDHDAYRDSSSHIAVYTAPPALVVPDLKELEAILDWILMLPCPTPKATQMAMRLKVVMDACRDAPPAPVSVPAGYRLQPISEYDAMCAAMRHGAEPVTTFKPAIFIDGNISPDDADKLADIIRKLNSARREPQQMLAEPVTTAYKLPELTDAQCLEFLAVAFRHARVKGDIEFDDIRLGLKMAMEAAPQQEVKNG